MEITVLEIAVHMGYSLQLKHDTLTKPVAKYIRRSYLGKPDVGKP